MKFSNTTVIIAALEEEKGIKPTLIELQKSLKKTMTLKRNMDEDIVLLFMGTYKNLKGRLVLIKSNLKNRQ